MAINPLMRSNPTRMMGMASGMDTQSIIQATLRMHQFKIDNQMRSRKLVEWKQAIHKDIKDQITSLRATYLSNTGAKTLMNRNAFNANIASATLANGKTSTAVSVRGTVNASTGSMTINQVLSLAKGASITSSYATGSSLSADKNGFTTGMRLEDLNFSNGKIDFGNTNNYLSVAAAGDGSKAYIKKSDVDTAMGTPSDWQAKVMTINLNGENKDLTVTRAADGSYKYFFDGNDITADVVSAGDTFELPDGNKIYFTEDNGVLSCQVKGDDFEGAKVDLSFSRELQIQARDANGNLIAGEYVTLTETDNNNGTTSVTNNGRGLDFYGETTITLTSSAGSDTVTLRSNMTLAEMISAVNNSKAGVTMAYDRMQDKFTIETKEKGGDQSLSVSSDGDILSKLFGDTVPDDAPLGTPVIAEPGSFAKVRINGDLIENLTSNTFDYRGVSITLNHTTSNVDDPDYNEPITVSVTRDATKAVDAIKDFINTYNTLIAKLEGLLNERKTGNEASYKPLTDEEKSAMTEKQIEEWEAIAKKGILRSDRGIQDLVGSLRATFFETIEGTGLSASQIGLSTGNYFSGTGGQIIIDEDKLRAAIEADPDRIADVFIKIDNSSGAPKGVGLMHKIDNLMRDFVRVGGTQENTLTALEKSYEELNERIAKLEERMWAEEDRLYRQFAAMETAMSKMQQQGDWFGAMLGAK